MSKLNGALEFSLKLSKNEVRSRIILVFREILKLKDFEKITVTEICEGANVSRKTFYYYFKDKNDIIEHIVLKSIKYPFEEYKKLSAEVNFPANLLMESLYKRILKDREFYIAISNFTGQNSLEEFIMKHTEEILIDILKNVEMSYLDKEYTVYFFAGSHTMLLMKWIRDGMIVSPQKMASYYDKWTIPNWVSINHEDK